MGKGLLRHPQGGEGANLALLSIFLVFSKKTAGLRPHRYWLKRLHRSINTTASAAIPSAPRLQGVRFDRLQRCWRVDDATNVGLAIGFMLLAVEDGEAYLAARHTLTRKYLPKWGIRPRCTCIHIGIHKFRTGVSVGVLFRPLNSPFWIVALNASTSQASVFTPLAPHSKPLCCQDCLNGLTACLSCRQTGRVREGIVQRQIQGNVELLGRNQIAASTTLCHSGGVPILSQNATFGTPVNFAVRISCRCHTTVRVTFNRSVRHSHSCVALSRWLKKLP